MPKPENVRGLSRNYPENTIDKIGFRSGGIQLPGINKGIVVTRNPFIRLYQVWSHSFITTENHSHEEFYKHQLEFMKNMSFRENTSKLPKEYLVSFPRFLKFVSLDEAHSEPLMDVQWQKVTDRCKPCELDLYDTVINSETANHDVSVLLNDMGLETEKYALPFVQAYHGANSSVEHVKQEVIMENYVKEVQKFFQKEVPNEITQAVHQQYYWDFVLFDYKSYDFTSGKCS